jgi:hypothetical protein
MIPPTERKQQSEGAQAAAGGRGAVAAALVATGVTGIAVTVAIAVTVTIVAGTGGSVSNHLGNRDVISNKPTVCGHAKVTSGRDELTHSGGLISHDDARSDESSQTNASSHNVTHTVFSFGWNLPPDLSCSPKQLDSSKAHRTPLVRG